MNRRLAQALVLVVVALGLSSCGDEPGYDAGAVESYLVSSQAKAYGDAVKVTAATCPEHRALRDDLRLTCTLTVSGARLPLAVHLTGARTDRVKVSVVPQGVVVPRSRLDGVAAGALGYRGKGATVDCGKGGDVVVAEVGQKLTCDLVVGSQRRPVTLTVKDATGKVALGS